MNPKRSYLTASFLARWLPAVLLVLVATNQLRLAASHNLSPWSGGGFGMFSSTDSPGNRHLHVYVQNDAMRRDLVIPPDLETMTLRATTLPETQRLAAIAMQIAAREADGPFRWDEVGMEVWTVDYDHRTLLPTGRLLISARFDVAPAVDPE